MSENKERETKNFIEEIIDADIAEGKHQGRVHTRFLLSQMVICILVMLKQSVLILNWLKNMEVKQI